MNKVMVSVICTNYNKGSWISDAIESFLRQEVDFEYEILLIDDKSTDGSVEIIKEYAERYPKKIRAFYNKKNLGITKTWIKICKEARGKYIARCDGDDYWIDDYKLQKQITLLENSKTSRWSNTDYMVVSSEGRVLCDAAFDKKIVNRSTSYAEALATKGFNAPSTWVIETDLMNEVNDGIDELAIDDTFNIQLDLFNKTELTFIPAVTAAYRSNEGSDSRPTDKKLIKQRDKKLLDAQLAYLSKYKDIQYKEIINVLLRENMRYEELAREGDVRLTLIHQLEDRLKELEGMINEKDGRIVEILRSKRYRVGKAILAPVTFARRPFKRHSRKKI